MKNKVFNSKIVLVVAFMIFCTAIHITGVYASPNDNSDIRVILDGSEIKFDVPPQIINDRTMVPMRAIFEALGYEVSWNGETNIASAKKGDHKICLAEDMYYISCTGNLYYCDTAPRIIDDRLLIPARAVAECAGCSVEWDEGNKIVSITSGTPKDFSNFLESEPNKKIPMDVDYDDTTQIYEKFRTEIFPETSEEFRTNKEVLSEAEHAYIDIDNDSVNELIIYFTTDSQNWGYMTIWKWKNDEHIMESLSVSVLERNSRPQQKEYVINYNNKNYLVYEYIWGHHGEKLLREEIFEYKDGWESVYNIICEGYEKEVYAHYANCEGVNRYFINGEDSDKETAKTTIQQLENAAVYNPAGGSMVEYIDSFTKEIPKGIFTEEMKKDFADYCLSIPTFDQSMVSSREFAASFIYGHYSTYFCPYENPSPYFDFTRKVKVGDCQRLFKLLFGADMADPTGIVVGIKTIECIDGYYYSYSGDYGDQSYVFDSYIPNDDGFEVIYSSADLEGNIYLEDGKPQQKICRAKYTDNTNGYILESIKDYIP